MRTPRRPHLGNKPIHHPVVQSLAERRAASSSLRIADGITKFAGSMGFVYFHIVLFALWMLLLEQSPWPTLTLVVSLEAIFLSTFVMIGQNRQSEFQQQKADQEFLAGRGDLQGNTDLTRTIATLTQEMHHRIFASPAVSSHDIDQRRDISGDRRHPSTPGRTPAPSHDG